MSILHLGSRGPEVVSLQNALNSSFTPSPGLVPDGFFGGRTQYYVKLFQQANWLVVDGIAGQCTQNAIYDTETYEPILKPVKLIPQPTEQTCWAASTAMITPPASVDDVINRTPSDLVNPNGSIMNMSDTNDPTGSNMRFATSNGLRILSAPMSWTVLSLRTALKAGPVMFDMLWTLEDYVAGTGSDGHLIVIAGIRGDDDGTGKGTTLRIFDPWAPTVGKISSQSFYSFINDTPLATFQVFQKI